ncbi:MAG: transposase [Thaumarchaeota archaeon]|nr:transposase [Nitrososphaerota archaeon]
MLARKSVKQRFAPPPSIEPLMESFRLMCNDAIRIGLAADASSLKRLSKLTYGELRRYDGVPSSYKLCAISKAAGILAARKKSIRRGFPTRSPYLSKPLLVSCYGLKIENTSLLVPLGERRFERVPLNAHTLAVMSQPGVKVHSFTLTERSLSLCIAKEVGELSVEGAVGIDRNLRNVTVGNVEQVIYYDVSKTVEIAENTRSIVRSFRRNDVRVRKQLAEKYGRRRQERVRQILNRVSKTVVLEAKRNRQAIAFENISGIRKLYRKGNGQGRTFRGKMNSWPFHELKRRVEYKAAWEGVAVITLSVKETRGTTMDCPRCGERLQAAVRDDATHYRQLWCEGCKRWEDRDLVAVMNISRRGWVRFAQSQGQGEAGEAVKGNPEGRRPQAILRVDASKLSHAQQTQ